MIHSIRGKVSKKTQDFAVIETAGIGFKVWCSKHALEALLVAQSAKVVCFYYPDHHQLYGFKDEEELEFFEKLIKVSGVGPKSALKLMNSLLLGDVKSIIALGDGDALASRGGIGKKTASRIILELRDEFKDDVGRGKNVSALLEVDEALKNLGYKKKDIEYAIRHIPKNAGTLEQQIKEALKVLAKR